MKRMNPSMNPRDRDDAAQLPLTVYVVFQDNFGFEVVGTAYTPEGAHKLMRNADSKPKSGRVICRCFTGSEGDTKDFCL